MIDQSIWISILFLITGAILHTFNKKKTSHYSFAIGWIFLGIYWLSLPIGFIEKGDYFNAFLASIATIFAWSISVIEFKYFDEFSEELSYLGKAAAFATLFYFPYHYLSTINTTLLQTIVANHTFFLLELFNLPVDIINNIIIFSGPSKSFIRINFACTGLGSMSLFVGTILASQDVFGKKIKILFISLFLIYVLNIFRNAFVIFATGKNLFNGWNILGMSGSYSLAHNFFSKIGSVIAIVLIAYFVLINLPDLEEKIFKLINLPKKISEKI